MPQYAITESEHKTDFKHCIPTLALSKSGNGYSSQPADMASTPCIYNAI